MELREIITPTSSEYTVNIPEEMIGREIELTMTDSKHPVEDDIPASREERIAEIRRIFQNSLVDLSNFKFDRDEANNYNE